MKKLISIVVFVLCSFNVYSVVVPNFVYRDTISLGDGDRVKDLAIDEDGNIFIIDDKNQKVYKYSQDKELKLTFGSKGFSEGQFWDPSGIDVDSKGNVYITDRVRNNIQKFTNDGVFVKRWQATGTGNGEFKTPNDIAVDKDGNMYLAEDGNLRIQKLDSTGAYVTQWAVDATDGSFFNTITSIAVDDNSNVYVIDGIIVKKYSSLGTLLKTYDSQSTPKISLSSYAKGISVDSDDVILIADSYNYNVKVSNFSGSFSVSGTQGSGENQFDYPSGIDVYQGGVYVGDYLNSRIVIGDYILGLNEKVEQAKFLVSNYIEDELVVKSTENQEGFIINREGKVFKKFTVTKGENSLDVNTLSSGIYFVRLSGTKELIEKVVVH